MANWKWLWQYVSPMKWSFLLAVLLCALDMLFLLGITGVQKWLIDEVILSEHYDRLTLYLLLFAAFIVGYNAVHLFSFMLNRANEYALQKKLTVRLMTYLYQMKAGKYYGERIGSIAQRFSGDIGSTSNFATHFVPGGMTSVVKVIVLGAFICWAHPAMLLLVCLFSLVFVAMGKYFGPRQKAVNKEVQSAKADVLVQIEEGVSSTREVIAFHRYDWELAKYARSFKEYLDKVMREGKLQNKQLAWSEPFRWGIQLIVLGYGAYLAIAGAVSVGMFVVLYQFSSQLLSGIHQAYGFFMNFSSRAASIERLSEFMADSEEQGGVELREPVRGIQFRDVSFRYSDGSGNVLDGLTLRIPIGQKVAFVGSSGGGKSTVAQLLERFFEPNEGVIEVNNMTLRDISLSSWRSRVNLVPQDPYLFPDTIRNNLLMGRSGITEEEMVAACKAADIHPYIENLPDGYDTPLGERGITLSGGQRQRLAIARSLLSGAEVLILDEATSALDMETERRVQQNLDALRAGKTTIIIAHRLSTVENADLIYVMDKGRIVEQGTHEELMASGALYRSLVLAKAAG